MSDGTTEDENVLTHGDLVSRYVTITLDNAVGERFDFRVLIDGEEYAKGNCATRDRAIQQAQHYAFMELSR